MVSRELYPYLTLSSRTGYRVRGFGVASFTLGCRSPLSEVHLGTTDLNMGISASRIINTVLRTVGVDPSFGVGVGTSLLRRVGMISGIFEGYCTTSDIGIYASDLFISGLKVFLLGTFL